MRSESAHQPAVKDGLRGHVEQPRKPRLVVVDDRQQSSTPEHLAKLESRSPAGAAQSAPSHVEELTVQSAALWRSLELEQSEIEWSEHEPEAVDRREVDAKQAAQHARKPKQVIGCSALRRPTGRQCHSLDGAHERWACARGAASECVRGCVVGLRDGLFNGFGGRGERDAKPLGKSIVIGHHLVAEALDQRTDESFRGARDQRDP